jgi:hypothetical protein
MEEWMIHNMTHRGVPLDRPTIDMLRKAPWGTPGHEEYDALVDQYHQWLNEGEEAAERRAWKEYENKTTLLVLILCLAGVAFLGAIMLTHGRIVEGI